MLNNFGLFFGTELKIVLLFLSSYSPSVKAILESSIMAIGFQICFYMSLAGFACAWHYRNKLRDGVFDATSYVIWPLLAGAFMVFVILQRFGKVPNADMGFILSSRRNKRDDGLSDYEPRKAGDARPIVSGTNQPISAAEVHEIKVTSANTWVPANSASGRRKQEKPR
jgi:hypothetical protein